MSFFLFAPGGMCLANIKFIIFTYQGARVYDLEVLVIPDEVVYRKILCILELHSTQVFSKRIVYSFFHLLFPNQF